MSKPGELIIGEGTTSIPTLAIQEAGPNALPPPQPYNKEI